MSKNGIRKHSFCACCAICTIALTQIGTVLRASAQTASTNLSFEAATVKPVDPSHPFDGNHFWAHVHPTGSSYWSMTPINLVMYAYGVESFQVTGPEWTNVDRFDIETRFPEGATKKDESRMLQALLKDRFRLSFHIEERPLEGYALEVGKHGEKLKQASADPLSPEADAPLKPGESNTGTGIVQPKINTHQDGSSTVSFGKGVTQTTKFDPQRGVMHYEISRMTMKELAERLTVCLGNDMHKIDDQTGISGTYQVSFDCPLRTSPSSGTDADGTLSSDPQDGSSLSRSLDALGLKLEKRKFLQKVYVIDHVEQPSEN